MPKIETLIDDIYKILDTGDFTLDVASLASMINRRLTERSDKGSLRMSNAGTKCDRKLWYTVHKNELAEPIAPHTRLKFLIGDILEEIILTLAKAAGHTVDGEQTTLEVAGVKGHRDAVIDGMVIDVKSANSRSFDKFKYHKLHTEDPFNYLVQLGLYVDASKDEDIVTYREEGAFLAVDKELGHLVLDRYRNRDIDCVKLIEDKKEMLQGAEPVGRYYSDKPDGKSGNMVIPMECKYCPFKEHCWRDANGGKGLRKVLFSNGPRWFTKVVREPAPKPRF